MFGPGLIVDSDNSGSNGGGGAPAVCMHGGKVIDCYGSNGGYWNGSCYERVIARTPDECPNAACAAAWPYATKNGVTGVVVECQQYLGGMSYYWKQSGEKAPTAAELENSALLLMTAHLVAPEIGVWPGKLKEVNPESMGYVGVPTWLYAKNPGEGVAAPLTLSTTVKGYTLRATASLVSIVYEMGDGQTKTCYNLGSVPYDQHDPDPSPSGCDYTYTRRGEYLLHVTTHLIINWTGAGKSGSVPVEVDRYGTYRVGEIQVVAGHD